MESCSGDLKQLSKRQSFSQFTETVATSTCTGSWPELSSPQVFLDTSDQAEQFKERKADDVSAAYVNELDFPTPYQHLVCFQLENRVCLMSTVLQLIILL
ncbi:unnamed protein product [Protopolystoma xenopodis]|uniref:Uncharacterized protein n=1 Tax=Protopolystoma xenopodis TaxID=117903 RepID=A0A448WTC3_9PLAT|nr:unnamed protein product [Protopolystoma xenopodis]